MILLAACDGSPGRAVKPDAAVPHHPLDASRPEDAGRALDASAKDAGSEPSSKPAADSGKPAPAEMVDASHAQALPDAGALDEDAGPGPLCHAGVVVHASGSPTVWMVVDGSGSMLDPLGDHPRWNAMRDVLVNPDTGIVKGLQAELRWGLLMYDGPGGLMSGVLPDGGMVTFSAPPATTCPRIVQIEPQLNNLSTLEAGFLDTPLGGSTPTDKALEAVLMRYPATPASSDGPISVVLATDGAPNDLCSQTGFLTPPPDVRPFVIDNVKELQARGITTYVLSLAGDDQQLTQHLTDVAAVGGTGKGLFTPRDKDALAAALHEIVGTDVDCSVRLNKRVQLSRTCDGRVALDGKAVPCDEHDGFSLHDEMTLKLNGAACARYRASQTRRIELDYPCACVAH